MMRALSSLPPLVALAFAGCTAVKEAPPDAESAVDEPPRAEQSRSPTVARAAPKPTPPPVVVEPPPPARPTDVELLIGEFERFRRLAPPDLAREQEAARQAFNYSRTDSARMRFAMSLAAPGHPSSDAALELLEPIAKNSTSPLHGLAFMMTAYIHEQRRLAAQVQGLQQNVQGLQQNVHALQQKLDALKTLERSLTEREAAAPRRR